MPEQGLELTSPDSFRAALVSGAGNVPAPPARPGLPPTDLREHLAKRRGSVAGSLSCIRTRGHE